MKDKNFKEVFSFWNWKYLDPQYDVPDNSNPKHSDARDNDPKDNDFLGRSHQRHQFSMLTSCAKP